VDLTPGQLLERLGFSSAHLSARVFELSGGQRRRLQFLLELLKEPNVLLLDEPTNDLDTDMLRAMEDLLDTWPGTLIVVSHDRYLLERITDNQFAILDGRFLHMPGGVDQFLTLQKPQTPAVLEDLAQHSSAPANTSPHTGLRAGSKERRLAEKEHAGLQRKIDDLVSRIEDCDQELLATDTSDYETLAAVSARRAELAESKDALEMRWLELAQLLEQ